MDDKILFGVFVYLSIILVITSMLPSELFTGSTFSDPDIEELRTAINISAEDMDGLGEQLSFFQKFIAFFFKTITIDGIPDGFALILLLMNYGSIAIAIIWIYDKARGIS